MIGAIVGDIIGSAHEFIDQKDWQGPLFTKRNTFTDDTVLTVATANAILHGEPYGSEYAAFFKRYSNMNVNGVGTPGIGYGAMFTDWP